MAHGWINDGSLSWANRIRKSAGGTVRRLSGPDSVMAPFACQAVVQGLQGLTGLVNPSEAYGQTPTPQGKLSRTTRSDEWFAHDRLRLAAF